MEGSDSKASELLILYKRNKWFPKMREGEGEEEIKKERRIRKRDSEERGMVVSALALEQTLFNVSSNCLGLWARALQRHLQAP